MDGLTVTEVVKNVVDIGITPVLLIVFIVFFIHRAKDDDTRVKKSNSEAQKAIREREGRSVDVLLRDVFRAQTYEGGAF